MNTENNLLKGPMAVPPQEGVTINTANGERRTMTLDEVMAEDNVLKQGIDLANMLVDKALNQPNPNLEFMALRYMAIHILGGQIFNTGMNSEEIHDGPLDKTRWDASKAFAAEKDVQEHLTSNIQAWKNLFESGQLKFSKNKV